MSGQQWPPGGWPPSGGVAAKLDPPTYAQMMTPSQAQKLDVIGWQRQNVAYPTPWLPDARHIAQQFRRYVTNFASANMTIGVETLGLIQIDVPVAFYAVSGMARDNTEANFPVGTTGLDHFMVRFEHNSGDRIDTVAGIASAMLGTAQFPAMFGGPAWQFDRGGTIRVGVTPLVANLDITVTAWVIELRGPTNFNNMG